MWKLKNKTNKTTQKQTHRYRKPSDSCQRGENWGDGRNKGRLKVQTSSCKINKDTGIQYIAQGIWLLICNNFI